MGERTEISWADSTCNFWAGCQKVSPACDNCYAEHLMGDGPNDRMKRVHWGPDGDRVMIKQGWSDIKKWNTRAAVNEGVDPQLGRRRRIFVNSLSDFFDNHRSVRWRGEAWNLIRRSPHLIFILLTKRPQLISRVLPPFWNDIAERVWLMTTVENQEWADRRVPELLASTAGKAAPAVFGLSCEPLLGSINLASYMAPAHHHPDNTDRNSSAMQSLIRAARREVGVGIDWVIAGGESGAHARPSNPDWFRALRDQCAVAGVPFCFKQWGEWVPGGVFAALDLGERARRVPEHYFSVLPVYRVGRTLAGHELDGREYQEFPDAR